MSNYTPRTYMQPTYPYQPPTSGLAVTALVLSLLGFSLLGLIFGAAALPDINAGRKSGKGMAVAGLVIGIVGSVLWLFLLVAVAGRR